MKPGACPRLFEVAAVSDGRISGAERTNFERHLSTCAACSREAAALDALSEAVRAVPVRPRDALHVRRERTRLLAAFDRELVTAKPSWSAGRVLWPTALAALVAAAFTLWQARAAHDEYAVRVHASNGAVWSQRSDGPLERVRLERGSLWIRVDHAREPTRHLVVELPDGELEDIGTTFTVSANDGRTTRVWVNAGGVVLRMRGQTPVAIAAGETWVPSLQPVAAACANTAPVAQLAVRPRIAAPLRNTARARTSVPAADASSEFRAAMAVLDRGDNDDAAAAFARFGEKHPTDPHAEDAAYLRVLALQRDGDASGTRRAALDYLQRYPFGFRCAEMQAATR